MSLSVPGESLLSKYVLSQGTWAGAGQVAAIQLLMLARAGYVRVGLEDGRAVRLVRTDEPDAQLLPEEGFLLRAVFDAGETVVLNNSHQKPVAQSAITVTRARLAKEGMIYQLSPRILQRRLRWGYLFTAVTVAICAILAVGLTVGVFVSGVALLVWTLLYNAAVRRALRGRNVFYRRKGRRFKPSADWRDVQSAVRATLLNSREQNLWCDNLPTDQHEAGEAFDKAIEIMAAALNQRFVPNKGHYRDTHELWDEGLRGGHEQLAEIGDGLRGNAVSYDGFDGDSGGGAGDDGGGGDSGDGGDCGSDG